MTKHIFSHAPTQRHPLTRTTLQLCSLALIAVLALPVSAADWIYTFRPGDNLWNICKQYTKEPACWQKLGPLNNIDRNRQIAPGTRIRIPASWLKVPAASATLLYVRGDVALQRYEEARIKAQVNDALPIGATLYTDDGTATIGFADGSSMVLEPQSELRLDTLSNFAENGMVDSSVRLQRGTVKTRVIPRQPRSNFTTVTPTAVAAVRGTEYRVNLVTNEADGTTRPKALVEVYEGLVDVGAEQKNVAVPATFGVVTLPGNPPQPPVKLLPAPAFTPAPHQHFTVTPDAAGIQSEPVTITWLSLENADRYSLEVLALSSTQQADAGDDVERVLQSQTTRATEASVQGLPLGCYGLRLQGVDINDLRGMAAIGELCLHARLPAPTLSTLAPVTAANEGLQVNWAPVDNAVAYQVEVASDPHFAQLLQSARVTGTVFSVAHPQNETPLFLRVVALDERGQSSPASEVLRWQPVLAEETDWWALLPVGLYFLGLLLL